MSAHGGVRAIIAAFFANLGIAIAKFVGYLVTGSSSMLAESIHSLADTGNQGLLILGRRRGERAADAEHPFGYGRERYFWAFVVALVLFSLGSLFSLYEGFEKLAHPHELDSPMVALVILAVAMVLEGFSLHTAVTEARAEKRVKGWLQWVRRSKNPELPVVLLEDVGALVGLVIAFAATVLAWKVDPLFDGYGTILIGVILGGIATLLAIEMKSLLIGESASPEDLAAISTALGSSSHVRGVIHLRTEQIGPDEILVAAKLAFDPGTDMATVAGAIDGIEAQVRAAVPQARLIYLEPDMLSAR